MDSSLVTCNSQLSLTIALLPKAARSDFDFWRERLEPLLNEERPQNVCARLKAIANCIPDSSFESVRLRYYNARKRGLIALVDRRLAGPKWWRTRNQVGLSDEDQELVKLYCEKNQRSSRSAIKALLRDWKFGRVKTATPIDPRTGRPRGWSLSNLERYAPTDFEKKATRIGRTAAASERQLVYTTRKDLWVGSHYMLDDMWHDFFINSFAEKQAGRPLELFSHDLYSSRKVRWGIRVRTRKEDGKSYNQLTEDMARYIVAATLFLDGYSERGTVLVIEHGTATLPDAVIEALFRISDRKITASFSGMTGAAAHAGQYPGISRGNFRHKASLESSNNLTHNVFAALPGQTGMDVAHRPEELDAMLDNNASLLAAYRQLPPERAALLAFPILELNQFHSIAHDLYRAIDEDPEHDLNDWVECGHVVTELLIGNQWVSQEELLKSPEQAAFAAHLVETGSMQSRPRKMTRGEVWRRGASELVRIPGHGVCAILGDDLAKERKVDSDRFEFEDKEVGDGVHRYHAIAKTPYNEEVRLCSGEYYETFVNPFAKETLFVRRADGSYIGECRRITKPSRNDAEAVHRRCGEVAKNEAELLAPIRVRHLKDARAKAARHERNAAVLSGKPLRAIERIHAAQERARIRAERGQIEDLMPAQMEAAPASEPEDAEEPSLTALYDTENMEPGNEQYE